MNHLSVIIPSRNVDNLCACVAAVRKHEPGVRIIVVDDGLPTAIDIDYFRMIVVEGIKPFVFARNVNIGIREAGDNDDVILLNDDALLESPGGFSQLVREAEAHPEFGIIGATTNVTGQWKQWRMSGPGSGLREVEHIAFVCVLIPAVTRDHLSRAAVQKPEVMTRGWLDERYCLDYGVEDRDYCKQVRAAGLKVGVHDGCYVDHGKLHSTFRGDPKTPASFDKNLALFREKWGLGTVRGKGN